MTPARTKKKTVKKKAPTKKKSAPKKKPPIVKKPAAKAAAPDKKKAAKPDAKKAAAAKAAAPSARAPDQAAAGARFGAQEARAKKAPKVRPSRAREPGKRPDLPLPTPVERPTGPPGAFGEKYVCYSCGAKFYDLGKPEPRCPKCGADQREAPRQTKTRTPAPATEAVEERPVKRSRLLDDDDDEVAVDVEADTDADDVLDLGLGVVDEGEDFGPDEPEEEEPEEEP